VFKINNEYDSRGHATIDLKKIEPLEDVAKRVESLITPQESNNEQTVISALEEGLLENFVQIHNKEVFPTWDSYSKQFSKVGGVIEAFP